MFLYKRANKIFAVISALIIFFSFEITAYAFNSDYIGNPLAWYNDFEISELPQEQNMNAQCLYKIDDSDGCFYMFFYYDVNEYPNNDIIEINFQVENDINTYNFSVDKNGFAEGSSKNAMSNIYIEQSFDNKGKIFIGFELRNSLDRTLDSTVRCEFSSGNKDRATLISDATINMFVPTTVKQTTTKNTTTKSSTTKKSSTKTAKTTKAKTTTAKAVTTAKADNSKESSTKFKASGITTTISQKSSTKKSGNSLLSKFKGSGTVNNSADSNYNQEQIQDGDKTVADNSGDLENNVKDYNSQQEGTYERTKQAKIAIVTAFILMVTGFIMIVFSLSSKGKDKADKEKDKKDDTDE